MNRKGKATGYGEEGAVPRRHRGDWGVPCATASSSQSEAGTVGAFLLSVKATTGEEVVIVGAGEQGLQEVWRHQLSVPGQPQILPEHYPDHPNGRGATQPRVRPQNESERAFLAIGGGAERWLRAAAASGTARVRSKMAQATELALLFGSTEVDQAL